MKIHGIDEVQRNVRRFRDELVKRVATATSEAGDELLAAARRQATHSFQEVTSYVYETEILHRHGGPGKYPVGRDGELPAGHFARRAPSIEGTPWEGQVQEYDPAESNAHPVAELLEKEDFAADGEIGTAVGYAELPARVRQILIWTIFGTQKEQPRPFLQLALLDAAEAYVRRVEEAVTRLVEEFR